MVVDVTDAISVKEVSGFGAWSIWWFSWTEGKSGLRTTMSELMVPWGWKAGRMGDFESGVRGEKHRGRRGGDASS
jgi:hypothetical protein